MNFKFLVHSIYDRKSVTESQVDEPVKWQMGAGQIDLNVAEINAGKGKKDTEK